MNTKRIIFWASFIIVLGLIIWGMVVAMNRKPPAQTYGEVAPVTSDDNTKGPLNAPVTVIEYSDFQCPACQAYYPLITRVISEASTTVLFVYRHFPLGQHKNARVAAEASEAAALQGKFWEMYALLFTEHTDWEESADPRPVFEVFAKDIGLDVAKFKSDLGSQTVKDKVEAQRREGENVRIAFTPTFVINGKVLTQNPQSYEEFKALIDDAAKGGQD